MLPLVFFRALYTFGSDGNPEGEGSADSPSGPQAELPPAPPSPNPGPLAEPRENMAPGAEYASFANEELREDTAPGAECGSLVNEQPREDTAPGAERHGITVN